MCDLNCSCKIIVKCGLFVQLLGFLCCFSRKPAITIYDEI